MDITTRVLTYFLDSKYRTGGTNFQPEFTLSPTVRLASADNYFQLQVLAAEIPYSFNTVNAPLNTVGYTMLKGGITTAGTITITPGTYTITTYLSALSTAFISVTGTSATTPTPLFTYSAATGKASLRLGNTASAGVFAFTLLWTGSDILAEIAGFFYTANTYLSTAGGADTSTGNISPNNVNVSPITALCLRSDSLNQDEDQVECLVEPVFTQSNILCKIPVQVPANSWIYYENNQFSVKLRNQAIEVLQFYLTSQTYDPVSFDGVHWRVTVQIQEKRPAAVIIREATKLARLEEATNRLGDLQFKRDELVDTLQRQSKKMRTI